MARKPMQLKAVPAQVSTPAPDISPEPADDAALDNAPEMAEVESGTSFVSALPQLQARRADLDSELSQVQGMIAELQDRERELHRQINHTQSKIDRLAPKDDNATAIQDYLAQQTRNRAANAARVNELLSMGADPSELAPRRSPLDMAVASKRPRGNSGYRQGAQ